jgi:hypothetical protein
VDMMVLAKVYGPRVFDIFRDRGPEPADGHAPPALPRHRGREGQDEGRPRQAAGRGGRTVGVDDASSYADEGRCGGPRGHRHSHRPPAETDRRTAP